MFPEIWEGRRKSKISARFGGIRRNLQSQVLFGDRFIYLFIRRNLKLRLRAKKIRVSNLPAGSRSFFSRNLRRSWAASGGLRAPRVAARIRVTGDRALVFSAQARAAVAAICVRVSMSRPEIDPELLLNN